MGVGFRGYLGWQWCRWCKAPAWSIGALGAPRGVLGAGRECRYSGARRLWAALRHWGS